MSRSGDGCEVGGPVGRVVGVADRWRAGCSLLAPRDVSGRVVGVLGRCLTTRTRGGGGVSVEQALSAAGFLDTAGVRVLAPALVYWSTVLRYRERVLRLLGRLGRRGICQVVVPCVRRELSTPVEPDWWDYRCHAGILYHFGLYDEVAWVAERALASEDPEVREVGQDEVERLLDLDDGQRPPRGCPEAPVGGAAHRGARLEDVPVGGADEQAEDLVLRAAQEGFEGARLAYYHGPVEEVVQVLRGWLVPGQGPVVPGRDLVDDALDAAQFLDGPEIRQLAPLLVSWLGSGAHHARALCLLCYLDHSSLRRILRPEAQAAGEAAQALASRTGGGSPVTPDIPGAGSLAPPVPGTGRRTPTPPARTAPVPPPCTTSACKGLGQAAPVHTTRRVRAGGGAPGRPVGGRAGGRGGRRRSRA